MLIARRPATPEDEPFLQQLMLERTSQELPLDHLPAPMRDQILGMQVRMRLDALRSQDSGNPGEMILADGEPAGWILAWHREDSIHLAEIVVLNAFRGQGIASQVIRELSAAADAAGKPITLFVQVMNPAAVRLYERLGFARIGGDEVQHEMQYR